MRLRFTAKTSITGGALYHPGDVAEVPDPLAKNCIARGWAQPVESPSLTAPPLDTHAAALSAPPRDKMIRSGMTIQKRAG